MLLVKKFFLVFIYYFIFTLFISKKVILAQNQKYLGFEEFNPKTRLGIFYTNVTYLNLSGTGFRDVQISDYEKNYLSNASNEPINKTNIFLNDINNKKNIIGVTLGFGSFLADAWGGGGEVDFYGFDNPNIIQFSAYVNYGFGNAFYVIAPFLKIGYNTYQYRLPNADNENRIELNSIPRLNSKNTVDINNGNRMDIYSQSFFGQIGLQTLLRLRKDLGFFLQIAYEKNIVLTQKTHLEVTGNILNKNENIRVGSKSKIELNDNIIVNNGTTNKANLEPNIIFGPLYFSVGVSYLFEY